MTSWLAGQTSPELLYLETKWASLIPYAKVVELLKDVLPVADTLNQETVRSHLHVIANRIEQGLGEESVRLFEGSDKDWEEQPLPDGPMTVGIDGGFVRERQEVGGQAARAASVTVSVRSRCRLSDLQMSYVAGLPTPDLLTLSRHASGSKTRKP